MEMPRHVGGKGEGREGVPFKTRECSLRPPTIRAPNVLAVVVEITADQSLGGILEDEDHPITVNVCNLQTKSRAIAYKQNCVMAAMAVTVIVVAITFSLVVAVVVVSVSAFSLHDRFLWSTFVWFSLSFT